MGGEYVVSFAFWYENASKGQAGEGQELEFPQMSNGERKYEQEKQLSAVINFNLWFQCGWETKDPYLDVGFKVKNLSLAKTLFFYFPFAIPEPHDKYIADLGEKFIKTELIDAVFNENYSAELAASSKTIKVKSIDTSKRPDAFQIYEIDIAHDIELEPFVSSNGYKGTIMKIPVVHIVSKDVAKTVESRCDTYYFRFRIKNLPLDFLIHGYTPRHAALQSIFNTTHMIDFRYHNVRSLDKSLVERFYEPDHHVVFAEEIHFLLITKAYVDVSGEQFKNTRKIEQQVWGEYVDGNNTEDLVAYNHVDRGTDGSGEMFARLRMERSDILWYILAIAIMNVICSFVATWLWQIFSNGL